MHPGPSLCRVSLLLDPREQSSQDPSFGIHFHLAPEVACRLAEQPGAALLELANGERWQLETRGPVRLSIEESTFFAGSTGSRQSMQVVLRGRCLDTVEVHWRLERVAPATRRTRALSPMERLAAAARAEAEVDAEAASKSADVPGNDGDAPGDGEPGTKPDPAAD